LLTSRPSHTAEKKAESAMTSGLISKQSC